MRSLTAQSIRLICLEDMEILPPQVFSKAVRREPFPRLGLVLTGSSEQIT